MSLTRDKKGPMMGGMLGTELAYVRERLKRCSLQERAALAKIARVHPKTVRRIVQGTTKNPSAATVGRLAMHFRTQEARAG